MNISTLFKQKGIGLIEVLIALLVVSLGLLALASFQGSLLKTSGNNKARAEAIGIAQQELELIRYAATDTIDFKQILSLPSPIEKTVEGTNAQFEVKYSITATDITIPKTDNTILKAEVTVFWPDAAVEQDSVTLMSEIGLQDIKKSAFATNDNAAAVAVPSPRQSASEDVRPASDNVDETDVVSPTETPLPYQGSVATDGSTNGLASSFNVVGTDGITYNLEEIAPDSRYYSTKFDEGVIGVYVCDGSPAGGAVGCRYIQNHFGGVSLSTSGIIYSAKNNNDLSNTSAVWSSSEVTACYVGPVTETGSGNIANKVFAKPYECIYAGNCTDSPASCQRGVTAAEVALNGVGPGGEFGNLGLINLDGSNGGDQVCYLENTPDWNNAKNVLSGRYDSLPGGQKQYNESYLFPTTTRTYVTRRMMSNGQERSEGINKSFRNHHFLLVNRTNNADQYKNCYAAVSENATTLLTYQLAPRQIIRVRTGIGGAATNPVGVTSAFSGTMPAVTINTASSGSRPNIYIPEIGSCYVRSDNGRYACVVPSNILSTTLYGGSFTVPSPTAASPATPVSYRTCNLVIDTTQATNISAISPSLCAWSAGYP